MAFSFPEPPNNFIQRFADDSFNPDPPAIPSTPYLLFGKNGIDLHGQPEYPERAILPQPHSIAGEILFQTD